MKARYCWIPTLIVLALFMTYFGMQAWHQLTTPAILGYSYNPTLKMYEPICASQLPDSWNILFILPMMITVWWHSSLYIFIPFNIFMTWCAFLIIVYRPCIDVGWSDSGRKKT